MDFSFILSGLLLMLQPTISEPRQEFVKSQEITSLPKVEHNAFKRGERLEYEVSYGWLDAGEAETR